LYNEELHNLYSSADSIRMKLDEMTGHVAHMGEIKDALEGIDKL
jgi:hypothetical protein